MAADALRNLVLAGGWIARDRKGRNRKKRQGTQGCGGENGS
jgi:hypothetical protein